MSEEHLQRPRALPASEISLDRDDDDVGTSPEALEERKSELRQEIGKILSDPARESEVNLQAPPLLEAAPEIIEDWQDEERAQPTSFLPRNPLEVPQIREDSVYACITAEGLKARDGQKHYQVPDGYVGLLMDRNGKGDKLLLPGEEAAGEFVLHLFRTGSQEASHRMDRLTTKDGFEASVEMQFGFRLKESDVDTLKAFATNYGEGRSHISQPILKSQMAALLREVVNAHALKHDVNDLIRDPRREEAEQTLFERLKNKPLPEGVSFLGLDSLRFFSHDLQSTRQKEARKRRDAKAQAQKKEIEAVIYREEAGAALSRAELSEVLESISHKKKLAAMEQERERLERNKALTQLEAEYKSEKHNLEAALKKMLAANDLEIDRIKFEEYLRMTQEIRERLEEDRIEFYINQIKDESLKAELLKRLIERDMTPDQLKELAELERARIEKLHAMSSRREALSEDEEEAEESDNESSSDEKVAAASAESNRQNSDSVEKLKARFANVASQRMKSSELAPVSTAPRMAYKLEEDAAPPLIEESSADSEVTTEKADSAPPLKTETREASDSEDELQSMLIVAGRAIYQSFLHDSGKATDVQLYHDMFDQPLGSLRSLQHVDINGRGMLLIGARRGVYSFDMETRRVSTYPLEAVFNPLTGVNSAIVYQGKIYATHSQFGLLRWSLPGVNAPANSFIKNYTEPARSVRSIFLDEDRWPTFACGRKILALEHDAVPRVVAEYSGAPSEILLVFSHADRFIAVCQTGEIVHWYKDRPDQCKFLVTLPEAISGATRSSDGSSIVLCTRSHSVRVYNFESDVIARYDSPQEMRYAREFGSHVFGISRNRSSLYLWESFGDGRPVTEVPLPDDSFDLLGI